MPLLEKSSPSGWTWLSCAKAVAATSKIAGEKERIVNKCERKIEVTKQLRPTALLDPDNVPRGRMALLYAHHVIGRYSASLYVGRAAAHVDRHRGQKWSDKFSSGWSSRAHWSPPGRRRWRVGMDEVEERDGEWPRAEFYHKSLEGIMPPFR